MRGRHAWDVATKTWGIRYPPYRKIWVLLLLTVNDRIFALQVPKVVPGKIVTQYEEIEAFKSAREAQLGGTGPIKEGIAARYLHVRKLRDPTFVRRTDKTEGNVKLDPNGALAFAGEAMAVSKDPHLYVQKVNSYVKDPSNNAPLAGEDAAFFDASK